MGKYKPSQRRGRSGIDVFIECTLQPQYGVILTFTFPCVGFPSHLRTNQVSEDAGCP
jgi:hypothetical protein